jgi:uncharacterized protein (UPF0276 family)/ribosomal protein S18 acetylase RimI-like enzyme
LTTLSDALELRDNGIDPPESQEYLYHAEANAAVQWGETERAQLSEIAMSYDPTLVSLHLATRYQETNLDEGRFVGVGKAYDRDALITHVVENVQTVRTIFGDVAVLLENNNHLGTEAYEIVTDPAFIDTVVRRAGADFLFDVAHAKISAETTGTPVEEYITSLPLDRCRQVHLSRHRQTSSGPVDAHTFLSEFDWAYFDEIQETLPNLAYVTLEYYADETVLTDQLERMQTGTGERVVTPEMGDSELFDRKVASVVPDQPTGECFDYAIVRCRELGIDCLYYQTTDRDGRERALERGFDLVGETSLFEFELDKDGERVVADSVRRYRQADVRRLQRIAEETFAGTRFYTDDHFETGTTDDLYGTWAPTACEDYADAVFVAVDDGDPIGYISCTLSAGHGEIGLVGVALTVRDSGVGRELVDAALRWFRQAGATRVSVETPAEDERAAGLYQSCGFTETDVAWELRRWFDNPPSQSCDDGT